MIFRSSSNRRRFLRWQVRADAANRRQRASSWGSSAPHPARLFTMAGEKARTRRSGSRKAFRRFSRIPSLLSTRCASSNAIFFETIQNYRLATNKQEAIERIDAKLRLVGLTYDDLAGKYPSEFSGGQLQRISIARALLTDPKLIIADEPVSMVDASLRMSIVNLFKRLRDDFGVSVLYITHDLATAYYVCDRIAIMFRGKIVEMGTVEQVLMAPKHPYTQLLRTSIPEADPAHRWQGVICLSDTEQDEYLRQGCRFAGRCPHAMDVCRRVQPPQLEVDGAQVACHLYAATSHSDEVLIASQGQ